MFGARISFAETRVLAGEHDRAVRYTAVGGSFDERPLT